MTLIEARIAAIKSGARPDWASASPARSAVKMEWETGRVVIEPEKGDPYAIQFVRYGPCSTAPSVVVEHLGEIKVGQKLRIEVASDG